MTSIKHMDLITIENSVGGMTCCLSCRDGIVNYVELSFSGDDDIEIVPISKRSDGVRLRLSREGNFRPLLDLRNLINGIIKAAEDDGLDLYGLKAETP